MGGKKGEVRRRGRRRKRYQQKKRKRRRKKGRRREAVRRKGRNAHGIKDIDERRRHWKKPAPSR